MNRRSFLRGLGFALAAPAIVHAGNLMPVKAFAETLWVDPTGAVDGAHFRTIGDALKAVRYPQTTIILAPGIYEPTEMMAVSGKGRELTIRGGDSAMPPIIRPKHSGYCLGVSDHAELTIDNVYFDLDRGSAVI